MTSGRPDEDRASDRKSADGAATAAVEDPGPDAPAPGDAFGALGGETRLAVVEALDEASPRTFSDLVDATDADTSAGFAYHLRQLTGRFVRRRADERYESTDAGRSAARALAAGTYTASVDRDPVALAEPCPLCGDEGLVAAVTDNVTEVGCEHCEGTVLRLSLPPGGYAERDSEEFADAIDAHHRRRIESFDDGVCPECAGRISTWIEPVADATDTDHGRDVRGRPIWNVGSEWRELVVSRDPWCVVVSARLDGEDLVCYVGGDGRVVDHRRESHDDRPSAGSATGDDTDSSADSDSSAVSTDDAESARASDAVESGAAES